MQKIFVLILLAFVLNRGSAEIFPSFGPAYDKYRLTLSTGEVTEALGPFIGYEKYSDGNSLFRLSPLFSVYKNATIPQTEFELAYPIMTLDKFGEEYRFQILQVFSFSGGRSSTVGEKDRFTLFPFYFQQRSTNAAENYKALVPFYGKMKNRIFRDEIEFVMLPLYLRTVKKEVETKNYLFPFFHLRNGPGLHGWQFWPVVGKERKVPTTSTNTWGDTNIVGGHEKFFLLWPFYFNNTLGLGTTNVQTQFVLLPFYTRQVGPMRESTSYGFPLGVTHTIDREKKYEEWGAPWPLVVFARGERKHANRIWPFFSRAKGGALQSDFYLWPVWKYDRIVSAPLDRERKRLLLFLYSDLSEKNTETGTVFRRRDQWPLYTYRNERNGNKRLQILALLDPLLPGNKSVERVYSPFYSIWRSETNARTGDSSKSFLWNLYRCEHRAESRTHSALFGLVQHQRDPKGNHWRVGFIPFRTPLSRGSAAR